MRSSEELKYIRSFVQRRIKPLNLSEKNKKKTGKTFTFEFRRTPAQSQYGFFPGLLGQCIFGDVCEMNGWYSRSDHETRNASAVRNNEAQGLGKTHANSAKQKQVQLALKQGRGSQPSRFLLVVILGLTDSNWACSCALSSLNFSSSAFEASKFNSELDKLLSSSIKEFVHSLNSDHAKYNYNNYCGRSLPGDVVYLYNF